MHTDMVWEYIQNIYNTIVLKDVVQRENLRNITLFENLMAFMQPHPRYRKSNGKYSVSTPEKSRIQAYGGAASKRRN